MKSNTETVVFGGGCFWCTQAVFDMFKGVVETTVGYAGGEVENPGYWDVAGGKTGHAEVIKVVYDPKAVAFEKLLEIFFKTHDPTTVDRQGPDVGSDYRSIILYTTAEQKKEIERYIAIAQKDFSRPIVTEVKKLGKFYRAEEEHQKFYEKNPDASYCTFVIRPKVDKAKKEFGLK